MKRRVNVYEDALRIRPFMGGGQGTHVLNLTGIRDDRKSTFPHAGHR